MTPRERLYYPAAAGLPTPAKPKSPFHPQEAQIIKLEAKDPGFPITIKTLLYEAIQERRKAYKGKPADVPVAAPGDAVQVLLATCARRGAGAWMTLAELCTQYLLCVPAVTMGQQAADDYLAPLDFDALPEGTLYAAECVARWMSHGPAKVNRLLMSLSPAMVERVARVQLAQAILLAAGNTTPQDVCDLFTAICPEDWDEQ